MIGKGACLGALFQSKGRFGSGHVGLNVHDGLIGGCACFVTVEHVWFVFR